MSGDTRFARRALAFVLLAASLGAEAQVSAKIPKIGVRRVGVPTDDEVDPFREALRVLGYSEGQNIVTEYRQADGWLSRLPNLAVDLRRLHVDVIVAAGVADTRAAQQATGTLPIVMKAAR